MPLPFTKFNLHLMLHFSSNFCVVLLSKQSSKGDQGDRRRASIWNPCQLGGSSAVSCVPGRADFIVIPIYEQEAEAQRVSQAMRLLGHS